MQSTGAELQRSLASGKELHLTNANGTNFRVAIEKRPVFVSDGTLTPEKIRKGGAALQTWLPAGEVFVAPVPDSADGTVVIDRLYFEGKEVTGVTMRFKGGKLTDLQARAGGARFLEMYQAGGPGKERFGIVDVGINANFRLPRDSKVLVFMAAGMISVWTGGNTWAGGDNTASSGVGGFIPGSTLKVDGKVIVEDGALKL
jgi:leucyl aminopeptidase (aminopeptidase T)